MAPASIALLVLAGLLAAALTLAVRQVWARQVRLQGALRTVRTIAALTEAVNSSDWPHSIHGLATTLVQTGVCRSALLFSVSATNTMELRASAYAPGTPVWDDLSEARVRQALEARQPLHVIGGDQLVPILEDGEATGLIAVRGFSGDEEALAAAVRLHRLALTGIRYSQKQTALSNTDGLTGLANHRHFQQMLSVSVGQAYLEGEPLGLILVDIDHFKRVNDTYGHLLGDLVLREIAYLLRRELPPDAVAARYGGEEMAVLLRGRGAEESAEVAERLRKVIADHQFFDFASGTKVQVTVSLGVALYELGQGKSRLVARADEALYASKREGRNRVTVALPAT